MRIVLSTFQTKDNLPSPHSHPPRFRRDVLEGTLEQMLEAEAEAEAGEADLRDERGNTTENVRTGQRLFPLKYQTSKACGINLGSSVVVTGGAGDLLHTVSEYNLEGWTRNGLSVFLQQYFKGGCAGHSRLKC